MDATRRRLRQTKPAETPGSASELIPFDEKVVELATIAKRQGYRRAALVGERLPDGYDYVGGRFDDVAVWRNADKILAVALDGAALRRLRALVSKRCAAPTFTGQAVAFA